MNTLQEKIGKRIVAWLETRYGHEITTNRQERAMRLVEESIELAQAEGVSPIIIQNIRNRVYSRPPGSPSQEAAGVMLCLVAWAEATSHDLELISEVELDRIEQVPVEISRQRHQAKADLGTALPVPK